MKKKFWQPTARGVYPIAIISGLILALAISSVFMEYVQAVVGEISRLLAEDMPYKEAVILLAKSEKMDVTTLYVPFSELMYALRLPATIPSVLLVCASAGLFGTVIIGTKKWRSKFIQSVGVSMPILAAGIGVNILFGAGDSPKIFLLMVLVIMALIILGSVIVRLTLISTDSKSQSK